MSRGSGNARSAPLPARLLSVGYRHSACGCKQCSLQGVFDAFWAGQGSLAPDAGVDWGRGLGRLVGAVSRASGDWDGPTARRPPGSRRGASLEKGTGSERSEVPVPFSKPFPNRGHAEYVPAPTFTEQAGPGMAGAATGGGSALLKRRREIGRQEGGSPAWQTLALPSPGGASRARDGRRCDRRRFSSAEAPP